MEKYDRKLIKVITDSINHLNLVSDKHLKRDERYRLILNVDGEIITVNSEENVQYISRANTVDITIILVKNNKHLRIFVKNYIINKALQKEETYNIILLQILRELIVSGIIKCRETTEHLYKDKHESN